jgi:hypothetical protein
VICDGPQRSPEHLLIDAQLCAKAPQACRFRGNSLNSDGSRVNAAKLQLDLVPIVSNKCNNPNSPAWLEHIQKANAALGSLTPERMANLRLGEAFTWSREATDEAFTKSAVKIRCRPCVSHHGGANEDGGGRMSSVVRGARCGR